MKLFVKIITFPLSVLYWIVFFSILLIFHGFQWIAFNVFGYQAHKKVVDVMNLFLLKSLLLVGVNYKFKGVKHDKSERPVIIISNHQSMFDIPPIIWYFRKFHPKFIAKEELGRGVPGISYNLRHGGSVMIDRGNRLSAMKAIVTIGRYINETFRSVVIFPEGTRSVDGRVKEWKYGGLITLFKTSPDAKIIPVTIDGSWKILKNKGWPVPFGFTVTCTAHPALDIDHSDVPQFIERLKQIVEAPLTT